MKGWSRLTEANIAPLVDSLDQLLVGPVEQLASFEQDGLIFDYFFSRKNADNLLVFFPSALPRDSRRVPAFHRWSWAKLFENFDVLCVADPTMRLDENMLGGWLVGNQNTWALEEVLKHIAFLQIELGYESVVFCGSSLGGFCAIQAGAMAEQAGIEVGYGGVYAENPQINLMTYSVGSAIDLIAKTGFEAENRESIDSKYGVRFNVVTTLRQQGKVPHGLVVIKESDKHHFEDQVPQLEAYLKTAPSHSLKVEVIPASEDPSGHTPLNIEQMQQRLEKILAV